MSTPESSIPDRSQNNVLGKIAGYLTASGRNKRFIKQFEGGYCDGISSLWLYGKWLQTQPNPKNKARDDYSWFKSTRDMIASWDGNIKTLSKENRLEFERFTSQIQFFHHIRKYLPTIEKGNLDESLEDTVGRTTGDTRNKRSLRREYSIGSLFTLKQLKELLKTENFIQDGSLIHIVSDNHAVALFKDGDDYFYFDSNFDFGELETKSLDGVAESIFISCRFDKLKPSPIGFRIFSFNEAPKVKYPSQQKILTKIKPSLGHEKKYAGGLSSLFVAERINCLESVKYFLGKGIDTTIKSDFDVNALAIAAEHGHLEAVKEILKSKDVDSLLYAFLLSAKSNNFYNVGKEIAKTGIKRFGGWIGSFFSRSEKVKPQQKQNIIQEGKNEQKGQQSTKSFVSTSSQVLKHLGGTGKLDEVPKELLEKKKVSSKTKLEEATYKSLPPTEKKDNVEVEKKDFLPPSS